MEIVPKFKETIVFDNGTDNSKVGYSTDDSPISITPTAVARLKRNCWMFRGSVNKEKFVGDSAITANNVYRKRFPINYGVTTNWDDMEEFWRHSFYEDLRVEPKDHPLILTEPPINPKACKERVVQIMFETFEISLLYINTQPFFTLYAAGENIGVVFDIGDSGHYSIALVDGFIVPSSIERSKLGGKYLTGYLKKLLTDNDKTLETQTKINSQQLLTKMNFLKENFCYVSKDFEKETKNIFIEERTYKVGEKSIKLGKERFQCPELMFKPQLNNIQEESVQETLYKTIMKCDVNLRDNFLKNIVLAGGSSYFVGFKERLHSELKSLVSQETEVKIFAPKYRKYSSWYGASLFASTIENKNLWLDEETYNQYGPTIVHNIST